MDPDLEDSDVDVVQPVQRRERRRGRLRKSMGSPAAVHRNDTNVHGISDDSDAPGPSRAADTRRHSSRAAAAAASRRLTQALQPSGSSSDSQGRGDSDAAEAATHGADGDTDSGLDAEAPSDRLAKKPATGRGSGRQTAGTPSRQSRHRRGPHAGANRAAAAGEAFRQRLAARRPAPDDAAVAEARRQSLQAGGAASDSDYESPPERSPPLQDFIVDEEEFEDEGGADDEDDAAGLHFRFEDDDGLASMVADEPVQPPKKRSRKQKAEGKRRRRRQKGSNDAGPLDAAPPDASEADAATEPAASQQVITLSSDDDDGGPQPAPRSTQLKRRRRRRRCDASQAHRLDDEDAAGPSGAAGSSARQLGDEADSDDAAALEGPAASAAATQRRGSQKRRRLSRVDDDTDGERTPPRRLGGGGPFERQRTLHDFLSPQQAAAAELEDEDAPTPRLASEEAGSSMDDFIEDDEELEEESSDDGDPVPAALERLRRSLGDNDRDVALARAFADLACGLLHHFMGADMDRQLHSLYKDGRWRIMSTLETGSHEVGGQLGWVNAERNGVVGAIRKFTHFSTAHAYFGSGATADHDTEDDRDGRFTCEVCGRSHTLEASPPTLVPGAAAARLKGGLASLTMSRPCRADAERLHLHSRSPGKKRPLRRRPPSDDEGGGGASGRRRRQQRDDSDGGDGSDADERRVFWVGSDCVQRVMLRTLLQHWTCLFADKLQRVSRRAIERAAAAAEDKRPLIAEEMAAQDRFLGFWCRHLRQTLGVAKKLETKARRAGFGHEATPASRFQSAGAEAIHLRNEFDQ